MRLAFHRFSPQSLVDEQKSPIDTHDFHTKDGYIYYGAVVKLVDTNSGISLSFTVVIIAVT